jgi:hypothetical protein
LARLARVSPIFLIVSKSQLLVLPIVSTDFLIHGLLFKFWQLLFSCLLQALSWPFLLVLHSRLEVLIIEQSSFYWHTLITQMGFILICMYMQAMYLVIILQSRSHHHRLLSPSLWFTPKWSPHMKESMIFSVLPSFLPSFCDTRVWTQCLVLARQALSMPLVLCYLVIYFPDRVLLLLMMVSDHNPTSAPLIAGIIDVNHHIQLLLWDRMHQLTSNYNPPNPACWVAGIIGTATTPSDICLSKPGLSRLTW